MKVCVANYLKITFGEQIGDVLKKGLQSCTLCKADGPGCFDGRFLPLEPLLLFVTIVAARVVYRLHNSLMLLLLKSFWSYCLINATISSFGDGGSLVLAVAVSTFHIVN